MDTAYLIIQQTLMVAVAIAMVALGGMFAERSGVINIALEGIMVIGAFAGTFFINAVQSDANSHMDGQLMLLLALLIAAVAGGLFSLLLAFSAINMKADQTIGGTAINMIAPALVMFIARTLNGTKNLPFNNMDFYLGEQLRTQLGENNFFVKLANIPVLGDLFFKDTYITVYLGIAIWLVIWLVLYKTKFGLRLRACGEHPQAADSVGINVHKMRYAGTILSGILGGIGGMMLIAVTVGVFGGSVNGYGFLALAVMIFGQWKPSLIMLCSLFFALMKTIASFYGSIPFLAQSGIPDDVFKMIPYIAVLVVLAFTSKKSRAPKAEGIPYDKGQR